MTHSGIMLFRAGFSKWLWISAPDIESATAELKRYAAGTPAAFPDRLTVAVFVRFEDGGPPVGPGEVIDTVALGIVTGGDPLLAGNMFRD